MKYISTVTILALCAVIPVHAKQVGKKTTPVQQPQIQTIPRTIQPQPMPQPRPQQPQIVQPEVGPSYTDIYYSLKNKKPESFDIVTLNNIKSEVERQITLIKNQKPISEVMKNDANQLVKKHYKPFEINQLTVNNAIKNNSNIFSDEMAKEHTEALKTVVLQFAQKFSVAPQKTIKQYIYDAITAFPSMATLLNQIAKVSNSQAYAAEFLKDIEDAISKAWDANKLSD